MPLLGLSPFLHLPQDSPCRKGGECQCPYSGFPHFYYLPQDSPCRKGGDVSMPLLGLSPFLRSTLGSRINRGHNLETIRVIVRQFIFAPILTSFFPSLGIFALFRRNGFSYNIFIIHVSRHRLKAFFHFNVSFSISFFRSYFPAAQKAPFRMPLCYFPFTLY